jgi:hypothetical protein
MAAAPVIITPHESCIVVHTRKRTCIPNMQSSGIAPMLENSVHGMRARFPHAVARSDASGIYNCHGLVFASRRTSIFPEDIHKIPEDDGYRPIDERDVLAGDVVLYLNADGDIEHSGIVIRKPELRIPWVVSKWGDGEEFVHPTLTCPYNEDITFRITG